VALARLSLRRTPSGLRIRRLYRFDYSESGMGRHTGHVLMLGSAVEEFSLGLPGEGGVRDADGEEEGPPAEADRRDGGKILPFRHRDP
jgi:hypothetical protein